MSNAHKINIPQDSAERLQYMKRLFPQATGAFLGDAWRGGRQEALRRLNTTNIEA